MRILRGLDSFPAEARPAVVALGTFDGIHLGHQQILRLAVERGRALGLGSVACTFDPHPSVVLDPDRAPAAIATLEENLSHIASLRLDVALVIAFTLAFSRLQAEEFVDQVLVGTIGAREVVVGFNHTFGRGARGTAMLLKELGDRHGFVVHVLPPLQVKGQIVSSSAIREALREGDVGRARDFLGRAYTITGTVLRGAGRGRTLGFPTANLQPNRPLLIAPGVYAARARSAAGPADAIVNIGYRPTFGENEYWIEAYLLDFAGDLYDTQLTLDLVERIRPEMKFPGVDALVRQVKADIETARHILAAAQW
jgi:riboflavin kinase/FMN adenylyltransferase